jgi:exonuclease SbcC
MSFRQRVELAFDGAPIWVLTGENGAGKSTVFDAITFALYGVHRGGKQNVDQIINRHCDSLSVEFDFMLGEDCYRIQRTASRHGRKIFQAWHLAGPNRPHPARMGKQPIPETDSAGGLSEWVRQHIALDFETFKMSVLLRQGESEALLQAEPRDRHALLTKLVDLTRYEKLCDRATEYHKQAKATVESCDKRLKMLAPVDDARLAALSSQIDDEQAQVRARQQQLEQVAGLKVHAQHWAERCAQHDRLAQECEAMRGILADSAAIERAAARAAELRTVLPALARMAADGQRRAGQLRQAAQSQAEVAQLAVALAEKQAAHQAARTELHQVQAAKAAAETRRLDALERQSALSRDIDQLDHLERLRGDVTACEEVLKAFPLNLPEQVAQAQAAVASLERLQTARPWLTQYVEARSRWRQASEQGARLEQARVQEGQRVADAAAQLQAAEHELAQIQAQVEQATAYKSAAEAALAGVQEQLARFGEVAGEPTCPYCGQALTEDHLAGEEARLQTEAARFRAAADAAATTLTRLIAARDTATAQVKRGKAEQQCAQKAQATAEQEWQAMTRKSAEAEAAGQSALAVLRPRYAGEAPLPAAGAVVDCFAEVAPSEDDLAEIDARMAGLAQAQLALTHLQAAQAEQAWQQSKLHTLQSQLAPLTQEYPAARAERLRAEYAALAATCTETAAQVTAYAADVAAAQGQCDRWAEQVSQIEAAQRSAGETAARASALAAQLEDSLTQTQAALPPSWQEVALPLTAEQVKRWEVELDALCGAEQRCEVLQRARAELDATQRQLMQIEAELDAIPAEARLPLVELEASEVQLRAEQQQAETALQQCLRAKQELEHRRQEIVELSTQKRGAEKSASLYRQLAELLGREKLQRYLLQQAEVSIAAYANAILDRCSGGALRMELRQGEDGEGAQRAFDLVVHNYATSDQPLAAWLLSGSQRFRVAISLALGIGQFASTNGRRVESVIIDEGFGSLDRNGLRDMAETLRDLSSTLRRVILVSHQDDFARTFSHRHHIALVNGASCLVEEPE